MGIAVLIACPHCCHAFKTAPGGFDSHIRCPKCNKAIHIKCDGRGGFEVKKG